MLKDRPVLELRFPGAELDEFNAIPLIDLLESTEVRALNLYAHQVSPRLYNKILGKQLKHFQHVGDVINDAVDNEFRYLIVNMPAKWVIIAVANAFSLDIPNGIETINFIVSERRDMQLLGQAIAYHQKKNALLVKSMMVSLRPGRENLKIQQMISEFLANCVPDWTKLQELQEIILTTDGFVVEIARPKTLGEDGDKVIRVTINDSSHIPEKWNCPDGYYFVVTLSSQFRDNIDNAAVRRLSLIPTIRAIHVKCPIAYRQLLAAMPQLVLIRNTFAGLRKLSGSADATLNTVNIPDASLDRLASLKAIFFQLENQPFDETDESECRSGASKLASDELKGICFSENETPEGK